MRALKPPSSQRDAAPAGHAQETWAGGVLGPGDAERLARLTTDHPALDSAGTVVLARDAISADRVYFERADPGFPGDTGWYIGPIRQTDGPSLEAVRVSELLAAHPDWSRLFLLPLGTLVVIDSAGIAAILDAADQDLWPSTQGL